MGRCLGPARHAIVGLSFILIASACTRAPATPPPPLALVNGTLIDGTGTEPVPDAIVVIENGYIVNVGRSGQVTIPSNAQVIDVQGGSILPGFINAHVHQAFRSQNLAAWVRAGLTMVVSLGDSSGSPDNWDEWIRAIRQDAVPSTPPIFTYRDTTFNQPQYARVVAAGPIVTVEGGYPSAVLPDIVLTVASPEEANLRVATLLEAGADLIKISLERGPSLSRGELEAIVAAAHERGAPVVAHVTGAEYLALAVEAGVDVAAHMVTDELPDELINQMVADDMYVVPTLAVPEALGQLGLGTDNLRRFAAAGGKVALGDDFGNLGAELGMPMRDMELMQEAGIAPMDIIVAATSHGAHVSGLDGKLGTLQVGRIADVLVVGGDPLQDIHALNDVLLVIKEGVVVRSPPTRSPVTPR